MSRMDRVADRAESAGWAATRAVLYVGSALLVASAAVIAVSVPAFWIPTILATAAAVAEARSFRIYERRGRSGPRPGGMARVIDTSRRREESGPDPSSPQERRARRWAIGLSAAAILSAGLAAPTGAGTWTFVAVGWAAVAMAAILGWWNTQAA